MTYDQVQGVDGKFRQECLQTVNSFVCESLQSTEAAPVCRPPTTSSLALSLDILRLRTRKSKVGVGVVGDRKLIKWALLQRSLRFQRWNLHSLVKECVYSLK